MNRICAAAIAAASLLSTPLMTQAENPFYTPFATEHGTPPFSRINDSQWEAAIDRGIELAKADINAITMKTPEPSSTACSMYSTPCFRQTAQTQ